MKKFLALILALAMVATIAACGKTAAEPPATEKANEPVATPTEAPAEKKWLIGYSAKTAVNDPHQQAMGQAVVDFCEANGAECVWLQTDSNKNAAQQASQVGDLISMGMDALIMNACDPVASVTILEDCKERGIPVILCDQAPDVNTADDLYVTYLGCDNFAAAKLAGEEVAKALGGEGTVIIVAGRDGSAVAQARVDGFYAGLEGTNVEVVAKQNGEFNNDKAMQVMENLLQAHADADATYTVSDTMVDGILQAIANHGAVNPNMLIMSFDGSQMGTEYVIDGTLLGTIAQFPKENGKQAAQIALDILNGKTTADSYEKFINTGSMAVTAENAVQFLKDAHGVG